MVIVDYNIFMYAKADSSLLPGRDQCDSQDCGKPSRNESAKGTIVGARISPSRFSMGYDPFGSFILWLTWLPAG
jgi:hypothetical protein